MGIDIVKTITVLSVARKKIAKIEKRHPRNLQIPVYISSFSGSHLAPPGGGFRNSPWPSRRPSRQPPENIATLESMLKKESDLFKPVYVDPSL